jgi:hypothetical protein
MTVGDIDGDVLHRKDLVVSFPGYGVDAWVNNNTWRLIHASEAPVLATSDLDGNGRDEVRLNFTGYGVCIWKTTPRSSSSIRPTSRQSPRGV